MLVSCSACGRKYKLNDDLFLDGKPKKVRCKACNELFVVQSPAAEAPSPFEPSFPAPDAEPPRQATPDSPPPTPDFPPPAPDSPVPAADPFGGIPWEGPSAPTGGEPQPGPFDGGGGGEWGSLTLPEQGGGQPSAAGLPASEEGHGGYGNISFGSDTPPDEGPAEGDGGYGSLDLAPAEGAGPGPGSIALKEEKAPEPPPQPERIRPPAPLPAPQPVPRSETQRRSGGEGPLITAVVREKKQATPMIGALVLAVLVVVAGVIGFTIVRGKMGGSSHPVRMEIVDKRGVEVSVSPQVRYYIVSGIARNTGEGKASFTRVTATIYDSGKKSLGSMTVACGHSLSEDDLRTMDVEQVKARLQDEFGQDLSNMDVPPGKDVPFMAAFFNPPPVDSFDLEILPLDKQAGR